MMGGHMHQGHEWMLTTCRRKDENALDEIITLEGGGGHETCTEGVYGGET